MICFFSVGILLAVLKNSAVTAESTIDKRNKADNMAHTQKSRGTNVSEMAVLTHATDSPRKIDSLSHRWRSRSNLDLGITLHQ